MDMTLCDRKGVYLKVVMYGNLLKHLFHTVSNVATQDSLSVIRGPRLMALRIIVPNGWFCSVPYGRYSIFLSASGRRTFRPRLQNRVFKFRVCINRKKSPPVQGMPLGLKRPIVR
jgi:hypothetical protein